ncbi:MAG: 2OG-Fe(II) oxygenase [Bdellovibrionota bacterium]
MFPANNLPQFFEEYFEELSTQSWTQIPIDTDFSIKLRNSAESKFNSDLFKAARVTDSINPLPTIRNDSIFWLDAKSETLNATDQVALTQIDVLKESLKNYFRLSLTELECHYAVYPAGHFYKKHSDVTAQNNKRIFSFVIYLNNSWQPDDGGELLGYEEEQTLFKIRPQAGNMILFKSELEHEVLTTYKTRYSLTGWIRK